VATAVDAVERYLRFKVSNARGRCVFIMPNDVYEFTNKFNHREPIKFSEIAYVLRALSSFGLVRILPIGARGVTYMVCRDSPLWGDPGLVREYMAKFEGGDNGDCFIDFHIDGSNVFITTNVADSRVFNDVVHVVNKMLNNNGLDLNELAKAVGGRLEGNRLYVRCIAPHGPSSRPHLRIGKFRRAILKCMMMGYETIKDITSCVYRLKPYKTTNGIDQRRVYSSIYTMMGLGLVECRKVDGLLRCRVADEYKQWAEQLATG
jgi:hypothetical protein